ncbi:MAG: tRNA adenosine(34) deaminase TadA [Terriglobia bacterium]
MRNDEAGRRAPSVDERFMRFALREAERGAREDEVPVGAIVVQEGRVLARAHNRPIHLHDPSAHAEVLALRRAARKLRNYRLEGCELYVTIEPCAMCVGAIVQARLRRIVFGARDLKAGACGSALRVLNHRKLNHRVDVARGILAADCALVIQEFFRKRRSLERGVRQKAPGVGEQLNVDV